MAKIITLKYDATCRDCGEYLEPGDRAKYYGPGKVYGVDCHDIGPKLATTDYALENWCEGRIASHYDPHGAYAPNGTYLGKTGPRCEDAPCCGCCTISISHCRIRCELAEQ